MRVLFNVNAEIKNSTMEVDSHIFHLQQLQWRKLQDLESCFGILHCTQAILFILGS